MSDPLRCPECGEAIPAGAPAGQCPKCLMRAGFESGSAAEFEPGPTVSSPAERGFTPPSAESLAPRFPQLEILELLGKGGMGAVYKARQPGLDRLVAVKILPPEVGRDPAFAERFTREARALARLTHPNIVAVYDFGQTEGLFYFVMEYVDGANLRQALHAGGLQPEEALAIVPQICDALQYAHDEGVVHRDIKPENILVDRRGRVKIADFGLAKLFGQAEHDYTLTHAEQVMGTPRYMAPEQMESTHGVDHRADIYSLGVVFYELLTGEVPMGNFDPPSRKSRVDVRLDDVVLRTLAREPARRYQRASAVKLDVESIRSSAAAPPVAAAPVAARVAPEPAGPREPAESSPVALPGLFMILGGCLNFAAPILMCAGITVMNLFAVRVAGPGEGFSRGAVVGVGPMEILILLSGVAIGAAMVVGGIQMRSGRNRELALLCSTLALLPCSITWFLNAPIGLWSLLALTSERAKRWFEQVGTGGKTSSGAAAAQPSRAADVGEVDLEAARQEVKIPAIGLMIVGLLMCLFSAVPLLLAGFWFFAAFPAYQTETGNPPGMLHSLETAPDWPYDERIDHFSEEIHPPAMNEPKPAVEAPQPERPQVETQSEEIGPAAPQGNESSATRSFGGSPATLLLAAAVLGQPGPEPIPAQAPFLPAQAPSSEAFAVTWMLVLAILLFASFPLGLFITWAGWQMTHLRSHGAAVVASIFALLPCQPASVLGLVFGIWSLVVLNKPHIKAAFAANAKRPARSDSSAALPKKPAPEDSSLGLPRRKSSLLPLLLILALVLGLLLVPVGLLFFYRSLGLGGPVDVLVFEAEYEPNSPDDPHLDLDNLVQLVKGRLSGLPEVAGVQGAADGPRPRIEVSVYEANHHVHERIRTRLAMRGLLHFRILAHPRDDADLVRQALAIEGNDVHDEVADGGGPAARWVDYDPTPRSGLESLEQDSNAVTRVSTGGSRQALVLLGETDVHGSMLRRAQAVEDEWGGPCISVSFNTEGSHRMTALTTLNRSTPEKPRYLGIIVDGKLISAPRIMSTVSGEAQISGNFTRTETEDLAAALRAGVLPVGLSLSHVDTRIGKFESDGHGPR